VDVGAIKAAAVASGASYRSFADATHSVLDLLERLLPDAALYLAHVDRAHGVHRIVDTRGGDALGLRSNLATPLADSYDLAMIEGRAPRVCNDVHADAVLGAVGMQRRAPAGSYLGVPLELSDGARVAALAALSPQPGAFRPDDEQLFAMLARVLAHELERETNERDL
jgi:GAF domain-containing protein